MALNAAQQDQVRRELESQFALAGLTEQEAAADLEWTVARLRRTVQLNAGADPVDVWQLRDYIRAAAKGAGRSPRFTILTDGNRLRASFWFRLRRAPRPGRAKRVGQRRDDPTAML